MREIPLSRGMVAIVDDEDYDLATAGNKWQAYRGRSTYYAQRHTSRADGRPGTSQRMHTLLTGWKLVDHINRDGLDNRRSNLRPANTSQNMANSALRRDSTSGFKGVTWDGQSRKWRAQITAFGKHRTLGAFDDPVEAAQAYDAAALELFGEFARVNRDLAVAS